MNIAKNMEFIFAAAVVLSGAMNYATAAMPTQIHTHSAVVASATMPVVTVSAHRLTAAQKAALAD